MTDAELQDWAFVIYNAVEFRLWEGNYTDAPELDAMRAFVKAYEAARQ